MDRLKNENYFVEDNLVSKEIMTQFAQALLDENFPWFFNPVTVAKPDRFIKSKEHNSYDKEFFTHMFVKDGEINSSYNVRELMSIFPSKDRLYRVKANLMLQDKGGDPNKYIPPHIDLLDILPSKSYYVVLYYVIDCDSDTFIFDENESIVDRIKPKRGRLLFMRGDVLHAGAHPVKFDKRLVINMDIQYG